MIYEETRGPTVPLTLQCADVMLLNPEFPQKGKTLSQP